MAAEPAEVAPADVRAAVEAGVPLLVDVVTMTSVRDMDGRFLYVRHDIRRRSILWWIAKHGPLTPGDVRCHQTRGYLVEYAEAYKGTL